MDNLDIEMELNVCVYITTITVGTIYKFMGMRIYAPVRSGYVSPMD
jgi:hypothetical protein